MLKHDLISLTFNKIKECKREIREIRKSESSYGSKAVRCSQLLKELQLCEFLQDLFYELPSNYSYDEEREGWKGFERLVYKRSYIRKPKAEEAEDEET